MLVAAFVLGAAGQVVKLCADAGVQGEGADERARGRVFALYDVVFNVGYVLAVAVAALRPRRRRAPWLVARRRRGVPARPAGTRPGAPPRPPV